MTDLTTIRDALTEVLENRKLLNGTVKTPFNLDPNGKDIDFGFGIAITQLISVHQGDSATSVATEVAAGITAFEALLPASFFQSPSDLSALTTALTNVLVPYATVVANPNNLSVTQQAAAVAAAAATAAANLNSSVPQENWEPIAVAAMDNYYDDNEYVPAIIAKKLSGAGNLSPDAQTALKIMAYVSGNGFLGKTIVAALQSAPPNYVTAAYELAFDTAFSTLAKSGLNNYIAYENRCLISASIMLGLNPSTNGSNFIINFSNIDSSNNTLVAFLQKIVVNYTSISSTYLSTSASGSAGNPTAFFLNSVESYLIGQGVYVAQPNDTSDSIASKVNTVNGAVDGFNALDGNTLQRINSVFSDANNFASGGLIHVPVAVTAVTPTPTPLVSLSGNYTYVYDPSNADLYTVGASLDGSNANQLIIDTTGLLIPISLVSDIYTTTGALTIDLYDGSGGITTFTLNTANSVAAFLNPGNSSDAVFNQGTDSFSGISYTGSDLEFTLSQSVGGLPLAVLANIYGSYSFGLDPAAAFDPVVTFDEDGLDGDTVSLSSNNGTVTFDTQIGADATAAVSADYVIPSLQDEYTFTSNSGYLEIDDPGSFSGIISNFQQGDTIELGGIFVVSASITSAGMLVVQEDDGTLVNLQLDPSSNYSGDTLAVGSNGVDYGLGSTVFIQAQPETSGTQSVSPTVTVDTLASDGVTEVPTVYSANITMGPTNIQFSPTRTDDFQPQTVSLVLSYTGGEADPDGSVNVAEDQSGNSYEYSFDNSQSEDIGPDNTAGTVAISTYSDEAGDYSETIPLNINYTDYDEVSDNPAVVELDVSSEVYAPALAQYEFGNADDGFYDFGIIHVGQTATVDVAVSNVATGTLADSLITSSGTLGEFSVDSGLDLAAGQTGTVTVTVTGDVAGYTTSDGALFNPITHDPELPDQAAEVSLGNGAISVSPDSGALFQAEIYNYAQPLILDTDPVVALGSGTITYPSLGPSGGSLTQTGEDNYTLDFGTISQSDTTSYLGNVVIENDLPAGSLADLLSGSFSVSGAGFIGSGITDDYGQDWEALAGSYLELGTFEPDLTSLGANTVTVVYDPTSVDSGGTTTLTPITLTVTDDVVAPCFAIGTRVATQRGEIAVEALAIGEVIQTQGAGLKPITWIGHRHIDCRRHPRPRDVWPVRIEADAFGPGMPHRDLFLSPDHAVFVEGVLIPIKHLVNGSSIALVPVDEVTYYHIELPEHDVLLAEGLPAESYLDTGDRANFSNGGAAINLFPDFSTPALDVELVRDAKSYARLMVCGPEVEAARRCAALASASSASLAVAAA